MALIKCPECGNMISDKAQECPKCGCTIGSTTVNAVSMLAVGTVLNGTYRIERHLSSGGFGNTYVATNLTFGDRVAVKEFFMRGITQRDGNSTISVSNSDNRAMFQEQLEKFKKEAQRIRQLRSPHIVRVHDMFDANGTAYYVMDYIDGESLSARLKRTKRPLDEVAVRRYLGQVLDGLESIHSAGLLHMDLKPDNIMIDRDDNAVLIDFGASKRMDSSRYAATMTGVSYTNGYAPPEQLEQDTKHFGAWTDIYALGATLYKLLTDRQPPMPSAVYADFTSDKHESLPFPPGVSTSLRRVIVQMLAVRWNARPQSIAALRNILSQSVEATAMYSVATDDGVNGDDNTRMQGSAYAVEDAADAADGYEDGDNDASFSRKWLYAVIGLLTAILIVFLFFLFSGKSTDAGVSNDFTEHNPDTVQVPPLVLVDDEYCYEGFWNSSKHGSQKCRVMFTKLGDNLSNCSYTNLKYNSKVVLEGSFVKDQLHFVGKIQGKDLVINLRLPYGDVSKLEGYGIDYAHSSDSATLTLSRRERPISAGLTFRTFTKKAKENGKTVQYKLDDAVVVSNLKKLGFVLMDKKTESRLDYTGEEYNDVTIETYYKKVNGNITTVELEPECTEIHFPNFDDVEEFKKTVRGSGLKETKDGFEDCEDIYWAGTNVTFKGSIVKLAYKWEP